MSNSTFESYSFRSVSDISREHLLFDLVDFRGDVVFDIGMSDGGRIEILFNTTKAKIGDLEEIGRWMERGKELIFRDIAEGG